MSMTEDRLAQIIEDNSVIIGHTPPSGGVGEADLLNVSIGIELGLGDDEITSQEFKKQVEELERFAEQSGITDLLGFVRKEIREDRYKASENPFAFLRSRILLLMEFEKMIKKTRGNKNSD